MDWKAIAAWLASLAAIAQGLGWYNSTENVTTAKSECQVALEYFAEEVNFWRQNQRLALLEEEE